MAHAWAQIVSNWPQSPRHLESWAHACQIYVDANESVFDRGTIVAAQGMAEKGVSVTTLTSLASATALTLMKEKHRHFKPFIEANVKTSL